MPTVHKLDGLITWTRREDWRDAMAEALARHTASACADAGVDIEDVPEILGSPVNGTIWGAAFEDLVASDLPDGRNIADEYLKRRGWTEPAATREYITALRHSVISLYEVSDVVPGESMLLRDLVRPAEPVRVFEKSGTRGLRQWDRIGTRVIQLRGGAVISGTLLAFDQATSERLLASLRGARGKAGDLFAAIAPDATQTASAQETGAVLTPELLLGRAAFVFTNLWLAAALHNALQATPPAVLNSDGDPLTPITLHFPLRPGVGMKAIRTALTTIPALRQADTNFWNWLAPTGTSTRRPARKGAGTQLITTLDDGAMVLGTVELVGRKVILSVNSEARAERGRTLLEPALHELVRPALEERQDLDQMLADQRASGRRPPSSGLAPDEEHAIIQQHMGEHYRKLLDQPIPSLGGVSPRNAVRSAKGREKVVAWLKILENGSARRPAGDPIGDYDFSWMWRELGLTELRR
jgi:hypothetical protein